MIACKNICSFLADFFPLDIAETWDNVGLLVGSDDQQVSTLMTCLTITPEVVAEAINKNVHFIISHHPLPFTGIKRLTHANYEGGMLLDLIKAGICIYSAHTAYDGMPGGINEQIASALSLGNIHPLGADLKNPSLGAGRMGTRTLQTSLEDLIPPLKTLLASKSILAVKSTEKPINKVAIACGAGGQLLNKAIDFSCDIFITGELSFHNMLYAKGRGMSLILPGHYTTERFAMKTLAQRLQNNFPSISIFTSEFDLEPTVSL